MSAEQVAALALPVDAVRLVFVDGHFRPELSARDTGLFDVQHSRAAERRPLPAPVQPEVFLHLTESLARRRDVDSGLPRGNQLPGQTAASDAHHAGAGRPMRSIPRTIATIWSWRRERRPRSSNITSASTTPATLPGRA